MADAIRPLLGSMHDEAELVAVGVLIVEQQDGVDEPDRPCAAGLHWHPHLNRASCGAAADQSGGDSGTVDAVGG